MQVRFLGVGGAFNPDFGNSSAVVEAADGSVVLIDCGCSVYAGLCRTGYIDRITHIVLTHLHDDHVGSLGSVIFHCHYVRGRQVEVLYPPALDGPLRTLFGLQANDIGKVTTLRRIDEPQGSAVGSVRMKWIDTTGLHSPGMPTFGYILREGEETIAYSGDLGDPHVMFHTLEDRGVKTATVFHDMAFERLSNHAYYKDLEKHLGRWDLYGYHNDPRLAPADNRVPLVANTTEFWPCESPWPLFEGPPRATT